MTDATAAAPAADVKIDAAPAIADKGAAPAAEKAAEAAPGAGAAADQGGEKKPSTVAAGADVENETVTALTSWPDDWRQRLAGKDKADLKTLERYSSIENIWKKNKELQRRLSDGTLPKKPEGGSDEEVKEWRAKVGLAESPEKLMDSIRLPDGRTIGDDDKPLAESFIKAIWEDAPPAVASKALAWYYNQQEEIAAQQIESDEAFQVENRKALKEEWGPGEFKRNINHISTLFANAPEGVFDRLMSARDSTGRLLGDNAEVIRWMVGLANDMNPMATITGGQGDGSAASRLAELDEMMRKNDSAYWKPEIQAEHMRLLELANRQKGRSRAA